MDFSVLGPLQVRAGDEVVPVRRGLPRVLLTFLLLHPGEPVPGAVLADRAWNGRPPDDAGNAVHRVVSYLRRTLATPEELPLRTTSGGYLLDVSPVAVDSTRFARLVRGADADPERALRSLDDALRLWRGDPLADAAHLPWAVPFVTELDELRVQAQERRLACLLELGRHADVVPEAQGLAAAHPLREGLHASLMLALYRSGRQGEALAVGAALRRALAAELGLDPDAAVVDLERRILAHDPGLAAPRPAAPAAPAPSGRAAEDPEGGRRGRPPRALTSLVGRGEEVAAVARLLDRAGLVTLTGPGGTGKTRLAIAVLERRHGAVWFADLAGVCDDAAVAGAVAGATGAPTAPGTDVVAAVVTHLGDRTGTLVLDTCEHVVRGAATVAAAVLRGCPSVRLLATSRRPLGVTGESTWPVPPLTLPPDGADPADADVRGAAAVELFRQRAVAVRPDFRIDDGTAADVAAICRALDGLPLAIELAAAHADVLSPARIRRRLDDRFALLVSGSRDVVARQRTLRAAIGAGVDLLTQDERALFAHLAVFAATFDLDAALAVAPRSAGTTDDDAFRLLASLVRQSLVSRAGADRYRLLDSVRTYALELLEASAAAGDVRRRHAEHLLALAEAGDRAVRTDAQRPWLALLREVGPDLRAALTWCLAGGAPGLGARLAGALAWFWTLEGQLAEAHAWLDRAARADVADPRVRARLLLGSGLVAAPLGRLADARDACAEAARIGRSLGDDRGTGDALITLGVALWGLGDLDAAATAHDEAVQRLAAGEDGWRRVVAAVLRARTAVDRGEADATDRVGAAVAAARRSRDAHLVGLALTQQARDALRTGRGRDAVVAAGEALEAFRRIGYREGEAAASTVLARAHLADGGGEAAAGAVAAGAAGRALGLAAAIGHRGALCSAVEALADVRAAGGDDRGALVLLAVADAERRACGLPEAPVEAGRTAGLTATLRARLGADAAAAEREAAGLTVDDVVARHRDVPAGPVTALV
ncbi:tetratricopeptide repeat protein [Geodermatophilus sp. YIM 151500]|uniref:AfsR/SARP family transcriptional regulator n=1 Tax=Geodermatophilus sp. YIM 151500 TaxID=2984531 RepID=UPI0021E493ED|nr:BTAD domain-containing putative transcriptional regulator [Geodermatophilus sp. YIM 151500]MCV2489982.1 tetratricopeptide repeat protein [Geodermatophilus sp. YIM 151500]